MSDHTPLSCDEFLDAVADAEQARGNDVNADEFRRRAIEHRNLLREREFISAQYQSLRDAIAKAEHSLRGMV